MGFSIFPALFDTPKNIHFVQQEADEKIELMLRQHWVTNVPWIVISAVLILVPGIFVNLVNYLEFSALSAVPGDIIVSLYILWYLGILAYVVEQFLHWYFNIYIVTNKHVVDINFYNITNRDITEIGLSDIQSVSSKIQGIIRSLFNFGLVAIETAAKDQQIGFANVPKPDFVADRIQDLQHQIESKGKNGI